VTATAPHTGPLTSTVTATAHDAFTTAMTRGFAIAALVAFLGAITVALALPAKTRAAEPVTAPQPANTRDVPDTRDALATA
jgi:hypothetical protein